MAAPDRNFHRPKENTSFKGEIEHARGITRKRHIELYEEFVGPAGSTLPSWLSTQDTSAAGTPTLDYVADASNGAFQLLHDAQDELQKITLYGGDSIHIPVGKNPFLECRIKINMAGATMSADQRFVCGLASARNATLDSIVTHAWVRMEGADLTLFTEADDGTTDTDDQDSTLAFVDNTWHWFLFDLDDLAAVKVWADLDGGGYVQCGAPLSIPVATGNLQFFMELQRDTSTEAEDLQVGSIRVGWDR